MERLIEATGELSHSTHERRRPAPGGFLAAQAQEQAPCPATWVSAPSSELLTFADDAGQRYRPLSTSHRAGDPLAITGVAVVELEPDAHFVHRSMVAAQLSRRACEPGDAEPILLEV